MAIATKQTNSDRHTAVEALVDRVYLDALEPGPLGEHALEQGSRTGGSESQPNSAQHTPVPVIEPRYRELTGRSSVAAVYDLWIASWETALTALATATQTSTLSTNEAAAHRTVIVAEREIVTKQLRLLVSQSRFARTG